MELEGSEQRSGRACSVGAGGSVCGSRGQAWGPWSELGGLRSGQGEVTRLRLCFWAGDGKRILRQVLRELETDQAAVIKQRREKACDMRMGRKGQWEVTGLGQ